MIFLLLLVCLVVALTGRSDIALVLVGAVLLWWLVTGGATIPS